MQCQKCKKDMPVDAAFCPYCGRKLGARAKARRTNGTGSVYKLSGRRKRPWCAVKDGVYIGYYDTKTEAVEAVSKLAGTGVTERYNWTFKDVYDRWSKEHFPDIGPDGVAGYELAYKYFSDLHDKKFRDLRTGDFQAILDRGKEQAMSTVSKRKQLLTAMSEWAVREEVVQTNFARFCTVKGRARVGHVPMDGDDVKKLYAAAASDEAAKIVCCLLSTGMRIGELFSLRLDDYHGDYVVGGEKTDAGRNRIIPIRPEGREHFAYFAEQAQGCDRLIDGYGGNKDPHNFRKREYAALTKRLGIDKDKSPHSARVTYTTQAVTEGLEPAVLQKVLGHSDFAVTQKYYDKPSASALVGAVEDAAKKKKPGA